MSRIIQEPVKTEEGDEQTFQHPAFGQITVHRVYGASSALYGSDFIHHSFVRGAIHESQLNRNLSHDWPLTKREIIAVDMSEAQWATFVSSFNLGGGVQCTLSHRDGKAVPEFPLRDERLEFKTEIDKKLADSIASLDKLIAEVEANTTGLTKAKAAAILDPLRKTRQKLTANLPFVAKSFDQHMEKRTEKAKVEINAYMTSTLQRAGLEQLRSNERPPLLIETEHAREDE